MIVNADDLGMNSEVNRAIASCFGAGRLSSTSLMANMPAFEEGCAVARAEGFAERIGAHLTLSEGPPLARSSLPYCDAAGQLAYPSRRVVAGADVTRAAYAEFRAQVERIIRAGIRPTHLDSHQHFIVGWPYTRAAVAVAREFQIPWIRPAWNALYNRTVPKAVFKWTYNRYLDRLGMRAAKWFTDAVRYFHHVTRGGDRLEGVIELMCHPGAPAEKTTELVPDETAILLSDEFGRFLGGAPALRGRHA